MLISSCHLALLIPYLHGEVVLEKIRVEIKFPFMKCYCTSFFLFIFSALRMYNVYILKLVVHGGLDQSFLPIFCPSS